MSEVSNIEWTDSTFNPWEGCTKVGPGCDHCYAEHRNARFGGGQAVNWGPGAPRRRTSESNWGLPLKWQRHAAEFRAVHGRRRRVFCASLADVFDNEVPDAWRMDLFKVIADTPDLDWLLVTKRIGNVPKYLQNDGLAFDVIGRNVWLGISVVNQPEADRDILKLFRVPAAVRFLSIEPMLGPIDLEQACDIAEADVCAGTWDQMADPQRCHLAMRHGSVRLLDWVICGGESGPKARPMHPDWARSLRDQCDAAGVPFLFKQHGEWREFDDSGLPGVRTIHEGDPEWSDQVTKCDAFMAIDGELISGIDRGRDGVAYRGLERIGKKAAGRLLDGRTHDEFPTHQGAQR